MILNIVVKGPEPCIIPVRRNLADVRESFLIQYIVYLADFLLYLLYVGAFRVFFQVFIIQDLGLDVVVVIDGKTLNPRLNAANPAAC